MLATVGGLHETSGDLETFALVDADRAAIERRHRERETLWGELSAGEVQARAQECPPETATGQVGAQTEPDRDGGLIVREVEKANERPRRIARGVVARRSALRIE